jgi:sensor histidine kinase YesM
MKKQLKQISAISLYWKCQFIFWSLTSLYWAYLGFIGTDFNWRLAILHFAADLFIYITLSHLYKTISIKYNWHTLKIQQLLIRIIPAILVLGFAFMLFTISKNYLVRILFQLNFSEMYFEQFSRSGLTTFVTGLRIMSIWVLAYYGYHFTQREINVIKENAQLAVIAKEAAFNNLSAQLNPHFFFNSLNSIKALIIENPHTARRAIDLLSDLLRTTLDSRGTGLITVKEEMLLVNDYLELEGLRFENRLQKSIEVDEQLLHKLIPPLSIQVLVENAIKHGIANTKGSGKIQLTIKPEKDFIHICLLNTGQLKIEEAKGLGLKNLKERLQLQFNGKASFHIIQQSPENVLATLKIPLT